MARIDDYRQFIEETLSRYAALGAPDETSEPQTLFDRNHDHYQLLEVGWDHSERIFQCIVHVDLKQNKIWIQRDLTETGITAELLERGVPKEDIVLAFHAPYKRPYTGYAVA